MHARQSTISFTLSLLFASACATEPDAADSGSEAADGEASGDAGESGTTDAESSGGESGSSTGVDIDALWDCADPMIADIKPLSGPGYDPEMGGLLEPVQDTYIVATTKIFVPQEKQGEFIEVSGTVLAELDVSPGVVAYGLGNEPTCGGFRTLSIYRSQAELIGFVASDAHSAAMERHHEFGITAKTTSWELAADEFPPTWEMADERLAEVEPF